MVAIFSLVIGIIITGLLLFLLKREEHIYNGCGETATRHTSLMQKDDDNKKLFLFFFF
jgi:hypothetical protein